MNTTAKRYQLFKCLLDFVEGKKVFLLFQECEAQSTRLVKLDGSESLRKQ